MTRTAFAAGSAQDSSMVNHAIKQVSEVPMDARNLHPAHKRIRTAPAGSYGTNADKDSSSSVTRSPAIRTLPPVPESPTHARAAGSTESSLPSWRERAAAAVSTPCGRSPRSSSPTPSSTSSSAFSAATTSAALSSRASLSSCRSSSAYAGSSLRGGGGFGGAPSRSNPRLALSSSAAESDYFPAPLSWSGDAGRRRWSSVRRNRGCGGGRESERKREQLCRRWSSKDYASQAGVLDRSSSSTSSSRYCGRKRSRSGSRERGCRGKAAGGGGVECERCLEWCRGSRERKAITRTLPMEYWVRTARCKAAKSKHIEYIDNMAYSREQFIEETVFTCPFTGARRDIVLERNMFPYDVPTDVEHWTLWSRADLTNSEMEEFVEKWASDTHPHAVEWECDNNEGDRSIDWYHVHVFFRLGCRDNTGAPRDPASVYDGPCGTPRSSDASCGDAAESSGAVSEGEQSAVTDCE